MLLLAQTAQALAKGPPSALVEGIAPVRGGQDDTYPALANSRGADQQPGYPPKDRPIGPKEGARLQPFAPTQFGWAGSHPDSPMWGSLRSAAHAGRAPPPVGAALGAGPLEPGPGGRGLGLLGGQASSTSEAEDRRNEGRMYPPPWWEVRPWWLNSLPWWLATPRSTAMLNDDEHATRRRKDLVASLQAHPYDTVSVQEVPEKPLSGDPLQPTGVLGGPLSGEEGDKAHKSADELSPSRLYSSESAVGREFGVGGPARGGGDDEDAAAKRRAIECEKLEAKQKGGEPVPDGALDGKGKRVDGVASECQQARGDALTKLHSAGRARATTR